MSAPSLPREVGGPIAEIRDLLIIAIEQVIDLTPDGADRLTAREQAEKGLRLLHNLRGAQEELRMLEAAVRQ